MEGRPLRDAHLFVCDATSALDIIDYWNLRAAGYYVVPIPIQVGETEAVKKLARDFIEENYRPHRRNPRIYHYTTVQQSRSLSEEVVAKFCKSLGISESEDVHKPKFLTRWWYPRLWDAWAREHASEGVAFAYSHDEERRISEGETRLDLRSEDPKFKLFREYSGEPRFANEFSFRFYGSKEPMAEVFPEGSRKLSSAIGRTGYDSWRFSKSGPVFLARSESDLIFLDLPRAETVMTEWFRDRGWKVSLSAPGRIAAQLVKQLGGMWGVSWLAHKGVVKLLGELEKEGGLPRQAVIGKLRQVIKSDKLFFDAEVFLERLLEVNALRLGARIQCPVCTRHNWYELTDLEYELGCRFCLSDFAPPLKSPKDIQWTYRAHGPYAGSIAQGAFTVLLTLRLLSEGVPEPGVTPLFSYNAEREGKHLEADLTCLYRPSTWRETRTYVVHGECKSFSRFEAQDVRRMKKLADTFPGSVLIFATLSDRLQESEVRSIRALAIRERKKELNGRATSPVIVLTGTELFSAHGLAYSWKARGGLYDELAKGSFDLSQPVTLADATQRLYLDLPSMTEWWDAERQKRAQNPRKAAKNNQQSS